MSRKTCSICLEDMLDTNISERKYNCNHYFHKSCISEWKGNCPLCRANELVVKNSNSSYYVGFKQIKNCVLVFWPVAQNNLHEVCLRVTGREHPILLSTS